MALTTRHRTLRASGGLERRRGMKETPGRCIHGISPNDIAPIVVVFTPRRGRRVGILARLGRDGGQVVYRPAVLSRLSRPGLLGVPPLARQEGQASWGW